MKAILLTTLLLVSTNVLAQRYGMDAMEFDEAIRRAQDRQRIYEQQQEQIRQQEQQNRNSFGSVFSGAQWMVDNSASAQQQKWDNIRMQNEILRLQLEEMSRRNSR